MSGATADGQHGYGWKFLDASGATYHNGVETIYPLPRPGEKWGPWLHHPAPATDGMDCGSGRWHVMRRPDATYAPPTWWPWRAERKGLAGGSDEKVGCHSIHRVRDFVHRIERLAVPDDARGK